MQLYYINLAHRTDRRVFMESQFGRLGLSATRIEAVTPRDLTPEQIDRWCNPRRGYWLEEGALSCSLSHLAALTRIAESSTPYGLILEDDVLLSSQLPAFLAEFEARPPALDILRIETTIQHQRLLPADSPSVAGVEIMRTFGWAEGAGAYILSKDAARYSVDTGELRSKVADQALLDPYEPIAKHLILRQAKPGLAVQTDRLRSPTIPALSSDIAHASRDAAEAPYFWRRLPYVTARWVHRDIVVGAQKAWHQYVRGAKKQFIPFLP